MATKLQVDKAFYLVTTDIMIPSQQQVLFLVIFVEQSLLQQPLLQQPKL